MKSDRIGTETWPLDLIMKLLVTFSRGVGRHSSQIMEEYRDSYLYYFKKFWGKGKETHWAINLRGGLY